MATIVAVPNTSRVIPNAVTLTTGQTSAGNSDNTVDRRALRGPADLVIVYTDTGGSQSVLVDIQGSSDASTWWNVPYALVATPSTYVVAQITFNTNGGGTVHYLLQPDQPWRYLRLVTSSQVATTVDASIYCYP